VKQAQSPRLAPSRTHRAGYALRSLASALKRAIDGAGDLGYVLDFGCGEKPYRELFEGRCTHYAGADLDSQAAADMHITGEGTLPLVDGTVDTVFSTQVLEHVADPLAYLREARRVLRAGGVLLLSTHGVWSYHPHPEDYWRWTASGLHRLLEQAGFEVVSSEGLLGSASAGLQLWQDAVLVRLPAWLRPSFVLFMQGAIAWSDRIGSESARARDAAIYVVLARSRREGQ
jgi:SAM-dependent methyltransferase